MRIYRKIYRYIVISTATTSLIFGLAHLLRVRSARGLFLRGMKGISEGLSPFLALAGSISALLAFLSGAPFVTLAGLIGAGLNARYVRRVIRPHTAFDEPFGEDWQIRLKQNISPNHAAALLPRRWSWRMPRSSAAPFWKRDMVYYTVPATDSSPETPLHCDVWLPAEIVAPSGIALLYVHGGGYFTSAKDFGTRSFFRHLVSQGHVAMDINYRLAPQANLFEMAADVLHAVAWLKENAAHFGASPDRVILIGGSAGAQLALLSAYAHDRPQIVPPDLVDMDLSVRAVVSYYGVIDLNAAYRRMRKLFKAMVRRPVSNAFLQRPLIRRAVATAAWVRGVEPWLFEEYIQQNQAVLSVGIEAATERLFGGSPDQIPEVYQSASPLTYAGPNCPPTLLFQGAHDYLLPPSAARKLHDRLRAAGVPSVYIELPQTEHTFDQFLPEISPPAQVALYDLERFLALVV